MKKLTAIIITIILVNFQAYGQDSFTPETLNTPTLTTSTITSELTVKVVGLDSDEGMLRIGIYTSEGLWLSQSKFRQSSDIVDGTATVIFENIPSGIYGISTYHDENSNLELDTNFFGIPSEPYASSRGAKGRFGPPKWNDAKFEITEITHTEEIKF